MHDREEKGSVQRGVTIVFICEVIHARVSGVFFQSTTMSSADDPRCFPFYSSLVRVLAQDLAWWRSCGLGAFAQRFAAHFLRFQTQTAFPARKAQQSSLKFGYHNSR